ncbi:MAG: fumarylacetoacetate hydrolase family protein [Chloroflexi bacterium]|jgi:2-keto-4-pentenoate hydratase/2-oxohepta-3-ene-1,7-dioic acid hydratase in catechol pathway|nr:fumarylacetoacetate hydrolase family protein [Chloroflexota bacterium]
MQIIRYQTKNNLTSYGWVLDDKIGSIDGSVFSEFQRSEARIPLADVRILPPVQPSKIICVGRNYAAHAAEHKAEVPEVPLIFLKPPSSIIAAGDTILLPPQSQRVEHEAELAIVIGRQGRRITPDQAHEYILGYTIANDITARDLQFSDGQWTRGKGFDTFCPIGPWITTDFDPSDALITCHVNDDMRQMASTRDMVFTVRQLIAFASSVMTLEPGDLLLTGTPAGVSPLASGDRVKVTIEGIGTLENPVATE